MTEPTTDQTARVAEIRERWNDEGACYEHDALRRDLPFLLDLLTTLQTALEKARQQLWLRHGCVGLYGDDGEMQCNRLPLLDFKRQPIEALIAGAFKHAELRHEAALETLRRERDDARRAFAICELHTPDVWEGDQTCVICEGHSLKARAEAAERERDELEQRLLDLKPTP